MRSKLPPFIAGVLTTTIIGSLGFTALAASGQVSFNLSAIKFNGQQISAKGEDYLLDNGCEAPSSITYTDEKGGGTSYLPVRRIAEMMGVDIGYDTISGSVTVAGDIQAATSSPTPTEMPPALTATPEATDTSTPADYSDWTAEEETAYQEFKAMWSISDNSGESQIGVTIIAKYIGDADYDQYPDILQQYKTNDFLFDFTNRYANETISESYSNYGKVYFGFSIGNKIVYGGQMLDLTNNQNYFGEIQIN